MITAKKRFGQNFLTDPHKLENLVAALDLKPNELVLEIGPGTGNLTELLLNKAVQLIAVELDRDLLTPLRERFESGGRFKLIENDIIKLDLRQATDDRKIKLIGNLPYNISGAIVEWLIEYWDLIICGVITVQKEVGARLKAEPGSRDYGSLSVITQSHFDIKRLFDLPPGCFTPKPKVDSTALLLTPVKKIDIDFAEFRDFLRAAFAQKRKKLANSLISRELRFKKNFTREELEKLLVRLGKKADIRAEQLSLTDFLELYKMTRE
jgi:16S rRNA (adenine1518-N6/adenine1519-N6)-dimethyltransferase